MQRRQPDATLTALNGAGALPADAVDVVVLSSDETLLLTLQQAAGTTHAIWHAPSADIAVELLIGGHCGILIADMNALRTDAAALLERLQSQFPELVLLGTGRRDQEGPISGLITKGIVYRFLHKPVSPARASLFLATAARRYHELSQTTSPALATVRQLARPSRRVALIGGATAILLAIAVVWFMRGSRSPAPQTTAPTISAPKPSGSAADELAAAKRAFDAGRLSAPVADNALDHYRAVLSEDTSNVTATAGVQQILDALVAQVVQALEAHDAPRAAAALKTLQAAEPQHPQLEALRQQLFNVSRSANPEPVVAKAPVEQKPVVATSAATPHTALARRRLGEGQLIEPESDSALFYLRQARTQNEDDSAIRILATDLGARLLDQSREAAGAAKLEEARNRYAEAIAVDREFDLALPNLAEVGRQIDELTATQTNSASAAITDLLAPAVKLRESGQLLEPAGNNAFELLQTIASQHPDAPEVRTERQRLAFTLLEHAHTSFAEGNLDRADVLVTRANDLVPGMAATQSLHEQIAASRAEHDAKTASAVANAGNIPRTAETPAVYPPDAQRRGVEGWVDLEFTIGIDGATRDVTVRDAHPAGVFNRAAMDALRKWRYQPVMRNGQPVEQRARLRMQFALQ